MTDSKTTTRSPLRLALAITALVAFSAFSTLVVAEHGYFAFVTDVVLASDWGLQVFLDLVIALTIFTGWMLRDAKARSLPAWPYLLAILGLGSIGALVYLVHREADALRRDDVTAETDATQSIASASTEPA